MGSMVYSNTTAAVDQESNSLEEDVYMPMAYSVGTLDQRAGESSHLSKTLTTCKYLFYMQCIIIYHQWNGCGRKIYPGENGNLTMV